MKLTIQEYEGIFDSRLVDVDDAIKNIHDRLAAQTCADNLTMLENLITRAERLKEAYEAYADAEAEEELNKAEACILPAFDFTDGLKALTIRKGK